MPWLDPAGRFSPFKLAVLLLLCLPGALIAWHYVGGTLGARPLDEAIHQTGNWAIRLLLVSLAITPARRVLQWPRLMQVRRMVGVATFFYVAAHLGLYVADQAFDLGKIALEIVLRVYLTIGFVALLVLAAMALTSTDGMIRRLGGRRWRRLHRLVYPAALLAVVHFFLQTKVDASEPWVMAGVLAWLMALRLPVLTHRRGMAADLAPVGLAVLAALATALGEASYYRVLLGVPVWRLLEAHFMFEVGVRPAWWVLAICLPPALLGALRRLPAGAGRLVRAGA